MLRINSSSFKIISSRSKRWSINVLIIKMNFSRLSSFKYSNSCDCFFEICVRTCLIKSRNWIDCLLSNKNLNSKSSLSRSIYAMSNFSSILLIDYKYSIILFLMFCVSLFQMHSQVESIVSLIWTWRTNSTFWYLLHAWIN